MTTDPTIAGAPGLVDRVKNILLKPGAEWDRIATEPADTNKLYMGYLLPLAVLAALCGFIGMSVFGVSGFGVSYKVPMVAGLISAVLQVVMSFVFAFLLAYVTNALAPSFGSQQDMGQAHKLSVYSATAGLVASVFTIFPPLAMLSILGLYSLFLLYIGLPRLMKTPEDKRIGYFASIIVICIVVGIVLSVVLGTVRAMIPGYGTPVPGYTFGQTSPTPAPSVQGEVTLPGGGSVDLGELEKMADAYASGAASAPAIDPARLQAFLPQSLPGGFTQVSMSTSAVGGMNASQAEAEYQRGDSRMTVTLVHMGALGGVAAMAGSLNVQESRQDADGYSRTSTVDGRIITEEMSRGANSASYAVAGRGVALTARGNGITVDEARTAIETIGVTRVEALSGG